MLESLLNPFNFLKAIKALNIRKIRKAWSSWKSWKLGFLAFSLLFFSMQFGTAQTPIPHLNAGVMDSVGILSLTESQILSSKITQLEAEIGSQIAVLIIPELENDEDILDYSVRVMEEWKLGRSGVDDGLLLVISLNDREVRIEVGYDLEGAIPDITAHTIIEQHLQPAFRSDQYALGINNVLNELIPLIQAEQASKILPAEIPSFSLDDMTALDLLFAGLILVALIFWCWLFYQGVQYYLFAMFAILCIALGFVFFLKDLNLQEIILKLINDPFLKEHLPLWMYQLLTSTLPPALSIILFFSMFLGCALILIKGFFLIANAIFSTENSATEKSHSTSLKPEIPYKITANDPTSNSWETYKESRRKLMGSQQKNDEKLTTKNPAFIDYFGHASHYSDDPQKDSDQHDVSKVNTIIITENSTSQISSQKEAPIVIDTAISPTLEKLKHYANPKSDTQKMFVGLFIVLSIGAIVTLVAYAFFEDFLVAILCGISLLIYQVLDYSSIQTKNRSLKAIVQAMPSSASYGVVAFFLADLTVAILVILGFIALQTLLLTSGAIKQPFKVIIISRSSSSRSSSSSSKDSSSNNSSSGRAGGGGRSGGGGASGGW